MSIVENAFEITPGTLSKGHKRVRPYLAGELVADASQPLLVWEHGYYPQYAFHEQEVEAELIEAGPGPRSKFFGPSMRYDVQTTRSTAFQAAFRYPEAPQVELRDYVLFSWNKMTAWFEEDEVVHVHARSPYVRLDALSSNRHVQVRVGDKIISDSHRPVVLYETGMGPRYYLPRTDVRMDLLEPTDTESHCPYKGTARYWSVDTGDTTVEDVVWGYETPLVESSRLAGLVCFWPEKSEDLTMTVDGVEV